MDRLDTVWDAVAALTYDEMIDFASTLRDTVDAQGMDASDAADWASVIAAARQAYYDRDEPKS